MTAEKASPSRLRPAAAPPQAGNPLPWRGPGWLNLANSPAVTGTLEWFKLQSPHDPDNPAGFTPSVSGTEPLILPGAQLTGNALGSPRRQRPRTFLLRESLTAVNREVCITLRFIPSSKLGGCPIRSIA